MIRRILLLLVVVFAVTSPVRTEEVDPSGIYRCEGKSAEGRPYQAVVEIKKSGETYLLRWVTPQGVAHVGVGVIRLIQLVGQGMVERRRGVILSIGSQTAFSGGENRGVYAAAKAAVSQITRAAAAEWGRFGVRVVCLAPGRSLTRMTAETEIEWMKLTAAELNARAEAGALVIIPVASLEQHGPHLATGVGIARTPVGGTRTHASGLAPCDMRRRRARGGTRTHDLTLTRRLLCQLSYPGGTAHRRPARLDTPPGGGGPCIATGRRRGWAGWS